MNRVLGQYAANGVSPSGKARGFDPRIPRFESWHPSNLNTYGESMSNQMPPLVCEPREHTGTIACRKLRKQDTEVIPAILYGEGKPSQSLSMPGHEVQNLHNKKKLAGHLFQLHIGKKKQAALVKAIQRHHLSGRVIHIDLQRIDKGHNITTNVPILFLHAEDCPAVKDKGQITYTTTEISVTCLPADLPEHVALDLSTLEIDQIIHLSELSMPNGVTLTEEITEEHNPTLVTAHMPKIIEEPVEDESDEESDTKETLDTEADTTDDEQDSSEKPTD